ncbi:MULTISPECIES: monovalent cation/H+ antiporter subunit D [unclassified Ruegeria]|uniref:monovalent cation/H+ antiporter subunit D n=1 Tax=unclassified Ruegeria TaxID=2625375 RepID=UPI0014884858|nr:MULTISPECIES: monovalent cation/H+ antiporter subunit D [unclassified Ruegeria]NOD62790.1 monovalent cation/H+ antiporter subunit D [Ruegeria sp. HKCCD6109]
MNHWIVAPIVLPAILAPFIIMVLRYHLDLQRIFSVAGVIALLGIALTITAQASGGEILVYELGNWPAPFGIVMVLDRLSAMMVLLTALLALPIVLYAIASGWDERGKHFHALLHFQLMGVCGAFLTGDAFNLFVFFEVLLIASYGLMTHGGGSVRLKSGVQYVAYNLLGSTLFLFALGTIYGVTGTLNMADIALRVAELPAEDTALLRVGAVLLLLVFCIKAAVLPLHFWLPASYANAPLPVAALFAIMTKVGAYSIIRMYTLAFGPEVEATQGLVGDWLQPAALLTLAVGAVGILGSQHIARMVAFCAIASMGTLLIAISQFTPDATAAALYYVFHSTLATALLFLVADLVMERRGGAIAPTAPMPQSGLISALFFVGAIAMAGMPPLSGFIGKLLVLDASRDASDATAVWAVILIGSFVTIVGLARAGTLIFWKSHDTQVVTIEEPVEDEEVPAPVAPEPQLGLAITAVFGLVAGLILLTLFAGPALEYTSKTAAQLFAPENYISAVLGREE